MEAKLHHSATVTGSLLWYLWPAVEGKLCNVAVDEKVYSKNRNILGRSVSF